jgi:hypothetical protein
MKTRRLIKRTIKNKRSKSKRTIRKHTKTRKYQKTKHWRHTTLKKGGDEEGIVNADINEGTIQKFIGPKLEPKQNFPHYSLLAKNRPNLEEEEDEYATIGEEPTDIISNPWERIKEKEEIYYTPQKNASMRQASMKPASMNPVKNNDLLYAQNPLSEDDIQRITNNIKKIKKNKKNNIKINDNDLIISICTNEINKFKPKIQEFLKEKLNERYYELIKLSQLSDPWYWHPKIEEKIKEIEKYDEKYKEKVNISFKYDRPGKKEEMETVLNRLKQEEIDLNKKFEEAKEIKRHYDIFKDENATDLEKKEAKEILEKSIPGYIESYKKIQECWKTINKKPEEPIIEIYGEGLYADLPLNAEGGRKTRKKRNYSHLRSKKHRLRI